jgi:hypothetical protein
MAYMLTACTRCYDVSFPGVLLTMTFSMESWAFSFYETSEHCGISLLHFGGDD